MSAIRFRTTAKGNLPYLSYIFRKSEPLGTEFKTVVCSFTGDLLFIEFQRGKEGMKHSNYHQELGETAACTNRMTEATKGIGQKSIKGGTKDFPLFDSWFASKNAEEAAMEVGAKFIGMVKTNTKGFCKENIENLTKGWPGVSYLVLRSKPVLPGYRLLIAIGYKYDAQKVLYFIVTDNAGSTKTDIPYLSQYPDQFTNVAIRPVAHTLVMSK